jgi:hypothetical protein
MRFARSLFATVAVSAVIGGVAGASEQRAILPESVRPYLVGGLPWGVPPASGIPQPWQASWSVEIGPLSVPSHSAPIADWREDFAKPPPPSLRPARYERPKQYGFSNTPSWHHHGRRR